jgi:chemotaxis protein histidine kinase CheA
MLSRGSCVLSGGTYTLIFLVLSQVAFLVSWACKASIDWNRLPQKQQKQPDESAEPNAETAEPNAEVAKKAEEERVAAEAKRERLAAQAAAKKAEQERLAAQAAKQAAEAAAKQAAEAAAKQAAEAAAKQAAEAAAKQAAEAAAKQAVEERLAAEEAELAAKDAADRVAADRAAASAEKAAAEERRQLARVSSTGGPSLPRGLDGNTQNHGATFGSEFPSQLSVASCTQILPGDDSFCTVEDDTLDGANVSQDSSESTSPMSLRTTADMEREATRWVWDDDCKEWLRQHYMAQQQEGTPLNRWMAEESIRKHDEEWLTQCMYSKKKLLDWAARRFGLPVATLEEGLHGFLQERRAESGGAGAGAGAGGGAGGAQAGGDGAASATPCAEKRLHAPVANVSAQVDALVASSSRAGAGDYDTSQAMWDDFEEGQGAPSVAKGEGQLRGTETAAGGGRSGAGAGARLPPARSDSVSPPRQSDAPTTPSAHDQRAVKQLTTIFNSAKKTAARFCEEGEYQKSIQAWDDGA